MKIRMDFLQDIVPRPGTVLTSIDYFLWNGQTSVNLVEQDVIGHEWLIFFVFSSRSNNATIYCLLLW